MRIAVMRARLIPLSLLFTRYLPRILGQSGATAAVPGTLQGAALPMYPPIAKAAHVTEQT